MLTPNQKKLLGSQGFFLNAFGGKIRWENLKGSDDDPVLNELSKRARRFPPKNRREQSEFLEFEKLIMDRMHERVNLNRAKQSIITKKYLEQELKRLKVDQIG